MMQRIETMRSGGMKELDTALAERQQVDLLLGEGSSCWLVDRAFDEVCEQAARLEGVVPVNLRNLALATLELYEKDRQIIAVGSSADDIVRYWPEDYSVVALPVRTMRESRDRGQRQLEIGEVELTAGRCCFVDDVAVSGLTLATARNALPETTDGMAVVGMAWNSRRLRQRVAGLESAIRYQQEGGGTPAVNTLATLAANPERRKEYADRRFGDARALEGIIEAYTQGAAE
jgi:hypothetical protein